MKVKEYILPVILGTIFVLVGILPMILSNTFKPHDRSYTGMEGFVDDYDGYVSFVKEGMSGSHTYHLRSLPPPQPALPFHIVYVWAGKIGGLLGWNAPLTYHVFRAISGLLLFIGMYRLYRLIFRSPTLALGASVLSGMSGSVGWFTWENGSRMYRTLSTFGFTDNFALRFASRPHYLLGAFLFLAVSYTVLTVKRITVIYAIGLFAVNLFLATMHPAFAILLGMISAVMVLIRMISMRSVRALLTPYLIVGLGLAAGMGVSYWGTLQYPVNWILSFEPGTVSKAVPLSTILSDMISFGPTLWIGLPGLVLAVILEKSNREKPTYLLVWIILQLALFFFLYPVFVSERVRYIQSLYFIPMCYGTVYLFKTVGQKIGRFVVPLGISLLAVSFFATYIYGIQLAIYQYADFKYYMMFNFPTKSMMAGYEWLDKNTPRGSLVIAGYEGAKNILIFSHNYVLGNSQGWPAAFGKTMERQVQDFFSGGWDDGTAKKYLDHYNVRYVFKDYQVANGFTKYPFLKRVFQNSDVEIFEVTR